MSRKSILLFMFLVALLVALGEVRLSRSELPTSVLKHPLVWLFDAPARR
jgi:hypothetical protein